MSVPRKRKKLFLLQEILPPYRVPLFNEIAKFPDVDLHLGLLAGSTANKPEWFELDYSAAFKITQLKGIHLRVSHERFIHLNYNLIYTLRKVMPDIIIFGGFNLSSLQALLFARFFKIPVILWSESTRYSEHSVSLLRKKLRRFILKRLDAILSAGELATEYLSTLNGAELSVPVHVAYNAVDNSYYYNSMNRLRNSSETKYFKTQYGKKVILFTGQLIERKGVWELLNAYKELSSRHPECALIMLGSGPLLESLKRYCLKHHLKRAFFEGFVTQDKIVHYFAITDVFILLSHYDCNPLVIFEALSSSLPIVASYQVGNTPEFVLNDRNGFVVDGQNTQRVVEALSEILLNGDKQSAFSQFSLELSKKSTFAKSAEVFHQVIEELATQ